MSVIQQAQDEQHSKLTLLEHQRLMKGQIYGEFASTDAMAMKNLNFV